MRRKWRCFHCDAVFVSKAEAAIHFGADEAATCACILPHEQHLVEHIRDLESQLDRYRAEDSRIGRAIMSLESDHWRALTKSEEIGYQRGIKDALLPAGKRTG